MDPHPAAHRLFLQPDTLLGVLTAGRHSVWQKTKPRVRVGKWLNETCGTQNTCRLWGPQRWLRGAEPETSFLSQWVDTCWPLSEPPADPSPRLFRGRECSWEGQPGFLIVPTATPLSPPCRSLSEMDPHMYVCICCLYRGTHTCLLIHKHTTCKHTYTIYTCPHEHVASHVPTHAADMQEQRHHT